MIASLFIIKAFLKTNIRSHGDEVTDFYDKEISKEDSNHTCLAVIGSNSALMKVGYYYPQVVLKKSKYIETKVIRQLNDNLTNFSSPDGSGECDKE